MTEQAIVPVPPGNDPLLGIIAEARNLPHWLRRYLMLIQSGAHADDAAHQVNANLGIIGAWTNPGGAKYHHAFARALAAIEAGVVIYGAVDTRDMAEAASGGLLSDAIAASRDPHVKDETRRNNRRDALEVGGLIGKGGTVAVQVNNLMSSLPWPTELKAEKLPAISAPKSPKSPEQEEQ